MDILVYHCNSTGVILVAWWSYHVIAISPVCFQLEALGCGLPVFFVFFCKSVLGSVGGTKGKVWASSKSVGFIIWAPRVSVSNLMAMDQVDVKTFYSGRNVK